MFLLLPVKKLSRRSTSWPSAASRSQRWEPRTPPACHEDASWNCSHVCTSFHASVRSHLLLLSSHWQNTKSESRNSKQIFNTKCPNERNKSITGIPAALPGEIAKKRHFTGQADDGRCKDRGREKDRWTTPGEIDRFHGAGGRGMGTHSTR
jgi:hypothetical protein